MKLANTRLDIPKELTLKGEKEVWHQIIGAYPADYFNTGDLALLVNYCRMKMLADKSYGLLKREGEIIENNTGNPITNPRLKVYKEALNSLGVLSTKLRIATNGRIPVDAPRHASKQAKADKVFSPGSDWRDHQRLDG